MSKQHNKNLLLGVCQFWAELPNNIFANGWFGYNNAKNTSIGHTFLELNCGYYLQILYKEDIDFYSKWKSANKLIADLKKLIIIC